MNILIEIEDLSNREGYEIKFEDVTFYNISFPTYGVLLSLSRHEKIPVRFENLTISWIKNSIIHARQRRMGVGSHPQPEISFSKIQASNIYNQEGSLFNVNSDTEISIHDSSFRNISTSGKGSIFSASSQGRIIATHSNFTQNMGFDGGILSSQDRGEVKLYYCSLYNNSAAISSIFTVSDLGIMEIHHSEIFQNYAIASPIGKIFNSKLDSIISNTTISGNYFCSEQGFISSISHLNIQGRYAEFASEKRKEYGKVQSLLSIRLIFSNFILRDSGDKNVDQNGLIVATEGSVLRMSNLRVQDVSHTFFWVGVEDSELHIDNILFDNVTTPRTIGSFIISLGGSTTIQD